MFSKYRIFSELAKISELVRAGPTLAPDVPFLRRGSFRT